MTDRRSIITKYKLSLPMILISGLIFVVLAWHMDANAGPDEVLRYKLVNWIINNNKLPTGFEEEIIDPIWGYSYAFTPYLPIMIGSLFAKTASLFTSSAHVLLFSCRMVNVFAGMLTVFVSFRVADKLMNNKSSVYYFVSVVMFLPQFVFLCSYLNNDVMNLLSAFMILDAVLDGNKNKWRYRDLIYLALGTAMCLLTYFFGYAWVLFAVIGYFYTAFRQEKNRKNVFYKALFVAAAVFLLAGWYFIRNAIIYNGDFLGYTAQTKCMDAFAAEHSISSVTNPGRNTMHLRDMLHRGGWIELTLYSFIGMFGGMVICLDGKFYDFYICSFIVPGLLFILYRYRTRKKIDTAILLLLLLEVVFPIAFSIYSSYTRDFSPQGRYIISILPSLCVFVGIGVDELTDSVRIALNSIKKSLGRLYWITGALAAVLLLTVFVIILYTIMLPLLAYIDLPGSDSVTFYYIR